MLAALAVCGLFASRLGTREADFIRGDANGSAAIELADAMLVLRTLFLGRAPPPCLDALDADDDGALSLTDAVYLLLHLFAGGPAPPAPFPACATDAGSDGLGCERQGFCPRHLLTDLVEDDGAVVIVIDRSGSVSDAGELRLAKRETLGWLEVVPGGIDFAVVAVEKGVLLFPKEPLLADTRDAAQIAGAVAFVESVTDGSGSCMLNGLLAALERIRSSAAVRKAVVFLTDGAATCPGTSSEDDYMRHTLERLEAENAALVPIHAMGVGSLGTRQKQFLQDLTAANGGELVLLTQ